MTYPLIGNYGRLVDDDQSLRPWLRALVVANATAAVLDGARQLAALLRDDGIPAIAGVDTRALARHLRTHGSLRGIVTAPGEIDHAAADRRRPCGGSLGGPGLRRAGLAAPGDGVPGGRAGRPADRDRGPRAEGQHRAGDAPSRGERAGLPPQRVGVGGARLRHRRRDPVARPGRSGPAGGPGGPGPRGDRRRPAAARDLPRPPDRGSRRRRGDASAAVRPPRSEPPGPGPRARACPGDRPEPRGPGHRRVGDVERPASTSARSTSTTDRSRGCATASCRSRPSSTTRKVPRGRSTRWRSSIGSWRRSGSGPDEPARSEARVGPDPGLRTGRDRPGGRVRLRRDAGVPRPAGRGDPHDPGQLEPGDDHDRPIGGRRDLPRAADGRGGRGGDRRRAPRGPARRPGRPDRAQPDRRDGRRRRLRALSGPPARDAARGDPDGRGSRGVPRPARSDRAAVCPQPDRRGRHRRRANGLGRRGARRHRAAGDHPPGVHPRRHRRRDRRDRGRLSGARAGRPSGEPDRPGHGRALPHRLAGDRVRGDARRGRHLHRGVRHGERRSAWRSTPAIRSWSRRSRR